MVPTVPKRSPGPRRDHLVPNGPPVPAAFKRRGRGPGTGRRDGKVEKTDRRGPPTLLRTSATHEWPPEGLKGGEGADTHRTAPRPTEAKRDTRTTHRLTWPEPTPTYNAEEAHSMTEHNDDQKDR